MRFRWTNKELETDSDYEILRGLVSERMSDLAYHSKLYKRLVKILNKLEKLEQLTKETS